MPSILSIKNTPLVPFNGGRSIFHHASVHLSPVSDLRIQMYFDLYYLTGKCAALFNGTTMSKNTFFEHAIWHDSFFLFFFTNDGEQITNCVQ